MTTTYECAICHGINSAARLFCQTCGTIPAEYSWIGKPTTIVPGTINGALVTAVAHGAERQTRYRSVKYSLRTVPADYYAEV